jgi:hypothetical protein
LYSIRIDGVLAAAKVVRRKVDPEHLMSIDAVVAYNNVLEFNICENKEITLM